MLSFIQAHQTIAALVAYYIASAFVGSLPSPGSQGVSSGPLYSFIFKFLNTLGGNLTRAFSSKLPGGTAGPTVSSGTAATIIFGALLLLTLPLSGCSAYQKALDTENIIKGVLAIGEADLPVLPTADQAVLGPWLNTGNTLNAQLVTCISAAGSNSKSSAFGTCFNAFAAGFTSPAELAGLHIASSASQNKAILWATAIVLAVNALYGQIGQPALAVPSVPSTADLAALKVRLGL